MRWYTWIALLAALAVVIGLVVRWRGQQVEAAASIERSKTLQAGLNAQGLSDVQILTLSGGSGG
jgi:hypothetical protein